jgi:ectoine hydroxylase-related dioxygenase (phytanoyl-CoA dioxygenase family)
VLDDLRSRTIVELPFFEAAAKQLLRAEGVHLWGAGFNNKPPSPPPYLPWQEEWEKACHIDTQLTLGDLTATPRRFTLGIWLWLTDVPDERGAMRILPGSHHTVAAHWEATLRPK